MLLELVFQYDYLLTEVTDVYCLKLNLNKSTNAYKYGNYNSSKKRGSNGSNESIVKKLSFLFGNN